MSIELGVGRSLSLGPVGLVLVYVSCLSGEAAAAAVVVEP